MAGRKKVQAPIDHNDDSDSGSDSDYAPDSEWFFGPNKLGAPGWLSADPETQQRRRLTASERNLLREAKRRYGVKKLTWKMPSGPMSPLMGKKKLRPSSASGNLQSHPCFHSSLYDNNVVRPATSLVRGSERDDSLSVRRPATHAGGPKFYSKGAVSDTKVLDEIKRQRRLTIGPTDGIGEAENILRPGHTATVSTIQNIKGKIEEKINIDTLEELKAAFSQADVNKSGKLDLAEFKALLKSQLSLTPSRASQIDALFMKIDWSSENYITWDEFCTYMQLEYAEKEDSYLRAKEVSFHLPAKIEPLPHRDPILRITSSPDGTFIACSQDGQVSFWTSTLEQKRKLKPLMETTSRQKPKWITDFVIMTHYNKFIVSTGDRELQFFELSSLEPYCQIGGLETVPLKLDYCSTGHDECLLLFGDSQGCVNILVMTSVGECLRTWKKLPKHEGFIASVSLDAVASGPHVQFIRWSVHGDWIQQLKYYHEMRQVISCSNNANSALVIGCTTGSTHVEQQLKEVGNASVNPERVKAKVNFAYATTKPRLDADQTVFKVYKGVKCFDFSKSKNILVTGGMDRIVRMWNPYVPFEVPEGYLPCSLPTAGKPTGMLRGHNAPIFYLFISEDDNRIFSISTDKCIKIWDIQDQSCLLTVRPKGHKIRGDLQAIHYCPSTKSLAVSTDQMAVLSLRLRPILHADIAITHKEPVTCVRYNPEFRQVVTCSEGSVIKLWDFDTGSPIFEYGEAHDNDAITCMTFDNTGRRLITGGRDGCMRIWNYNNGHCLRVLKKTNGNEEVCACTYVEMNRNRYVIAVGWDRRINIYSDSLDGNIHHVQNPLPKWADDLRNGHKEDILSVAQCPPNLLATSSYDGEVIVWNMISGHIFCHLNAPPPREYTDQSLDGDMGINKVTFLKTRGQSKDAASLITSGPRGHIHMWNVFQGGTLMAQFKGSKMSSGLVTCVKANDANTVLFSTDSYGFIYAWRIDNYCLETEETKPPEILAHWRGHIESITWLELIEDSKMLITSSSDCTVRMWTLDGDYVGTFGQPDTWDVHNSSSYQHPMVPYDVLIDPLSLPEHPVLEDKQDTHQIIHGGSPSASPSPIGDKEKRTPTPTYQANKQQFYVDDNTIAEQLKQKPFSKGTGKRLRHEKTRPVKREGCGPSEYRMLKCYDLMDTPQPTPPQLHINKNDPFSFYVD